MSKRKNLPSNRKTHAQVFNKAILLGILQPAMPAMMMITNQKHPTTYLALSPMPLSPMSLNQTLLR
ncbi:hypothetical protein BDR22DRAFT_866062 [Usnea florida]